MAAHIVLYYNPQVQKWVYVDEFDVASEEDAQGAAAIATGQNGKYFAVLISEGSVANVTLNQAAEALPATWNG